MRQDAFSRKWFTLETAHHHFYECVAVLPKPIRRRPVVIYAHGYGGKLVNDGDVLRRMAQSGLAVVNFEYNQTNEMESMEQFADVLHYVYNQEWADTNAIAWVGFSMGANRMWDFALQHPEQQPQLLVQLSGAGLSNGQSTSPLKSLHCLVLMIHGDRDGIFAVEDTRTLASALHSNNVPVDLRIIPNAQHDMDPDRELVFRCIGEYCLMHLSGTNTWQNDHSITEWKAESLPFWLFCTPAVVWALGCFAWLQYFEPRSHEKFRLKPHEIALRCVAAVLAIWALADTALHQVPPYLAVTDRTLAIARKYLVPAKERADLEFLATLPIWHDVKLETLLTHAELANYNRELINWQLDETNYEDYVLSPIITDAPDEQLNWRRPLWEEFYPRIRHETSPEGAAVIVVRHLRECVTIAPMSDRACDVPTIWLRQITDETGFQIIYVAALRSVGIPARLDARRQAQFFDGTQWKIAPAPAIVSF